MFDPVPGTVRTFVSAAALLALLPAGLTAQDADPRPSAAAVARTRWVYRPAVPVRVAPGTHYSDRVIVKFAEGVRVRLVGGELACPEGRDVGAVVRALEGAAIECLFTRDPSALDAEREELQRLVPPGDAPLADLNNYFRARTSGADHSARVVEALLELPLVETAYPEFAPAPIDDLPPTTPLFELQQSYLDAPPAGYGYRANESVVGARGEGLRMAQLEGSWTFGHEDLPGLVAANVIGRFPPSNWNSWREHGTACVGIMVAGRNRYGVRGMGSDRDAFFVSSLENGSANMINMVAARLSAGDVMSSSFAWVIGGADAPVDWEQSSFDAVRNATARGILYTFGAGNSGNDLGNTALYGSRYAPLAQSSGGFIIGGTLAGTPTPSSYNYGARVDANGWGSSVTTTGAGDLFDPTDPLQRYTSGFGGTSAAGPAVAGAIASLVGAVKEQNARVLTNAEVRQALTATGTPVGGVIGRRPDLPALFARFGLPDGLLVTREPTVGGQLGLAVGGLPGEAYGLVLSNARGRVSLGLNRALLLDAAVLITVRNGTLDAAGADAVSVPVPADPSLADLDVYLQGVRVRAGSLSLTNSVATRVL
jgi:hypothetical protein